ncbi:hypothetical protein HK098_006195 [Nowakowskiella sp. JEL0407]|nr:hypothetical protein HK098_006195 [Nowakowskiella sp. JEL0407]
MSVVKLSALERTQHLYPLVQDGWEIVQERDAIKREFVFKNFTEAWKFMNKIAEKAEILDHHPEFTSFNFDNFFPFTKVFV